MQTPPELPPKTYSSITIITTKQSNKTLIRFLYSLSNFIFFGGSLAGLVVWFYQIFIFPKLKIRTEILTSLRSSTLKSYDQLLENLKNLVRSNPRLYHSTLSNQTSLSHPSHVENREEVEEYDKPSENRDRSESTIEERQKPHIPFVESTITTATNSNDDDENDENERRGPNEEDLDEGTTAQHRERYNQPMIDYLGRIANGLRKRSGANDRGQDPKERQEEGHQERKGEIDGLKSSLKAVDDLLLNHLQFNTRIHQKLVATSHPHRAFAFNHWPSSASSSPVMVDDDPYYLALIELKNEIRNLKSLLLNRKKFY